MSENTTHMLTIDGFDNRSSQTTFVSIRSVDDGRDSLFMTFDTFSAASITFAVLMGWTIERFYAENRIKNWVDTKGDVVLPYSDTHNIHIGIMGGG